MPLRVVRAALFALATLALLAPVATARTHARHHSRIRHSASSGATPLAAEAPEKAGKAGAAGDACDTPAPVHVYAFYHCYTPQQISDAYNVTPLHNGGTLGQGQTIVLVDSYGSPTAANDIQFFHDTFYPGLPNPDFDQVCSGNCHDYNNVANGNGQSGPNAAEGWAGEANLDIEWAYAMAPRAHIVLLAVPPAETEGVQGFPNLFKAIQDAVNKYPSGTVFSQSFGVTEQTFGGAAGTQTAKFDQVYKSALAKGDTVLASSGDDGSSGASKQQKDTRYYGFPNVGWPASSPYVTAVGGTQLQYGWTWDPTSDTPFTADGDYNAPYWNWNDGGNSEPVWNESWLPAASGGGPSVIYKRPSYQNPVASSITDTNGNQVNARGVPDVAWNAAVNGGVLVYTSFFPARDRVGWHVYGGTSAASPQVAGLVALANQQQADANEPPIGFLNPLIYGVGGGPYRDIVPQTFGTAVSGQLVNNRLFSYNGDGVDVTPGPVPGLPTTSGWDETTGYGSPDGAAWVAAIRAARNTP
jgi:subtilase family serine protease